MRIFGSERISGLMLRLGMEEGVPIEHGLVTKSIERAQKQVEAQNFGVRKHLLEYDDVMNKQREAVYGMRRIILEGQDEQGRDSRAYLLDLSREVLDWYLESYVSEKADADDWNLPGLHLALKETYGLDVPVEELAALGRSDMAERLGARIEEKYRDKELAVGPELMRFHERMIMLQIVDTQWKDHLYGIDHLKEGIGLRGYAQKDPLVEYKRESYDMFTALMDRIDEEILRWIYLYQPVPVDMAPPPEEEPAEAPAPRVRRAPAGRPAREAVREPVAIGAGGGGFAPRPQPRNLTFNDPGEALSGSRSSGFAAAAAEPKEAHGGEGAPVQTYKREQPKVGRNDACPCGSGKKYKKCHGAA
jgi:preprotein translocase subunit SecA